MSRDGRNPRRLGAVWLAGLAAILFVPASAAYGQANRRPVFANQANCVTPSIVRIPASRAVTRPIMLRWMTNAASPIGQILVGNTVLATLPPLAAGPITETVSVDLTAIQAHLQEGARRVRVLRLYGGLNDGPGVSICTATIEFASSLGGPLDVFRIQLRLGEGSPLRIVARDTDLTAYADLNYSGGGELVARWEVAGSESTSGAPLFRVIERVRRQITGGGRVTIESPELPTELTGLHLVRLVIETPALAFQEPALRYYVADGQLKAGLPTVIGVRGPAHGSALHPDMAFRWSPLPGASAYRVEFHAHDPHGKPHLRFDDENPSFADLQTPSVRRSTYEEEGPTAVPEALAPPVGKPVAGVLVEGNVSAAKLSTWALRSLEPGEEYVWVVRGLAEAGIPIGMSAPRLLRVPAN